MSDLTHSAENDAARWHLDPPCGHQRCKGYTSCRVARGIVEALPCCNYIEAIYDHDPEGPCEGTMVPGWPEYVCGTCGARCGALAHPGHSPRVIPPEGGSDA